MKRISCWLAAAALFISPAHAEDPAGALRFAAEGAAFRFDTGRLSGLLRSQGRSLGLQPVVASATKTELAGPYGLFSHDRLLDAEARYGGGAWDWPSQAELQADGSVITRWSADEGHPFDMAAHYTWCDPGTLDLVTTVTARRPLRQFEVFLASYFAPLADAYAFVEACPQTDGKAGLLEAKAEYGFWQTFPRDEGTAGIFADGRWRRPPNPVDWTIMPRLASPLSVRRDPASGLTALVMAPADDCFAISMPHSGEGHRSIYLSLLGRDLAAGESAAARSRLVIGSQITDEQAVALYRAYVAELQDTRK